MSSFRGLQITIQCMKRDQGLTDEAYRNLLKKATGLRSTKEFTTREQFERAISLMGGTQDVTRIKIQPKERFINPFVESKPAVKWNWVNATEQQWSNFGNLISKYDENGIIVVAVWDADGSKKFKWRYK